MGEKYVISSLTGALAHHSVMASVVDFDHYRSHGVCVETNYIIEVKCCANTKSTTQGNHLHKKSTSSFSPFKISKTFHRFRTLARQLRKAIDEEESLLLNNSIQHKNAFHWDGLSKTTKDILKLSASLTDVVDSEGISYLGKVNYGYVKYLSKQRRGVIDDALMMILTCFPSTVRSDALTRNVVDILEAFFLEDHVVEEQDDSTFTMNKQKKHKAKKSSRSRSRSISKTKYLPQENLFVKSKSIVKRASVTLREIEMKELDEMGKSTQLLVLDESHNTLQPIENNKMRVTPTVNKKVRNDDPLGIRSQNMIPFAFSTGVVFYFTSQYRITIELDLILFAAFSCFCLGLNIMSFQPHRNTSSMQQVSDKLLPKKMVKTTDTYQRSHDLIRKSLSWTSKSSHTQLDHLSTLLPMIPKGDDDDSKVYKHVISLPRATDFLIRGSKYLTDRKKIESKDFLLRLRGVELFLTDACPENVARNPGVMNGELREIPTLVINFRLPWGVFIVYLEIPEKFLPFLQKKYSTGTKVSTPSKKTLTPGERTLCRFLLGDNKHKDNTLKLIPRVVKGPWIVKSVVGKPAIIGNKLPTKYIYEPADEKKEYAEYLELDLDIVSSAAGRRILSVCRSYTESLTLDLGFVIQGNSPDELPEQMLGAIRVHGLNPLEAPPFPPMKTMWQNLNAH